MKKPQDCFYYKERVKNIVVFRQENRNSHEPRIALVKRSRKLVQMTVHAEGN